MKDTRKTEDNTIPMKQCLRCEHKWPIRKEQEPRVCPKCKSPYWNAKRQK